MRHLFLKRSAFIASAAALFVALAMAQDGSADLLSVEAKFLHENRDAMDKMMTGMTVSPSGDVDQDFAAMMIPHHQGAIDMAKSELRYGRNEQLRRIAQEIIIEQQQEITAMRLAVNRALPAPPAGPGGH